MAIITVLIDILDNVRWREVQGTITEISRVALVQLKGLPPNVPSNLAGESIVTIALRNSEVPQPGAPHPVVHGLFVVERFPIIRSRVIVQIEIRYKRPNLEQPPPGEAWVPSGGAGLEEISTQLDRNGTQIITEHEGIIQGGQIHPLMPRRELQFSWSAQADTPGQLVDAYVGKVNSDTWQNGSPRTWLCMSFNFGIANAATTPVTYDFTANFRQKDDGTVNDSGEPTGHDPQIIFIDPETGKPPSNLVAGEGYKTVVWYDEAVFGNLP